MDNHPFGKKFGHVLSDVQMTAYHPGDTVTVRFVGANPRVSGILRQLCLDYRADIIFLRI